MKLIDICAFDLPYEECPLSEYVEDAVASMSAYRISGPVGIALRREDTYMLEDIGDYWA